MNEKLFFKIAIIVGIIGVLGLLFISENLKPREIRVCGASNVAIDSVVSLVGTAVGVKEINSGFSFYLADGGCEIKCVLFGDELGVKNGDKVRVAGVLQEYMGKKEILADKVVLEL